MKNLITVFVVAVVLTTCIASAQEVPKMKMTTEIPRGLTTPDNIQTRVGELNFFDGVPDIESAQKIYSLLDFTHAYQACLDGTKIASMEAMRNGILDFGPANTTAILFEDLMDSGSSRTSFAASRARRVGRGRAGSASQVGRERLGIRATS